VLYQHRLLLVQLVVFVLLPYWQPDLMPHLYHHFAVLEQFFKVSSKKPACVVKDTDKSATVAKLKDKRFIFHYPVQIKTIFIHECSLVIIS
jgi:hypothetical protein